MCAHTFLYVTAVLAIYEVANELDARASVLDQYNTKFLRKLDREIRMFLISNS
jgi:hypothetical protein